MKPKFTRNSLSRKVAQVALLSALTLSMAGVSSALELHWNTATGDFNTAANWIVGTGPGIGLPGVADNANLGNGGVANYSGGERTIMQLRAGNGAAATVNFTGGTFTATNGMWAGRQNGATPATVNVSGAGTVVNVTGENTRIGNGSGGAGVPTAGATGILNISAGGTLNHTNGGTTFRVGDKAGIAANSGVYKGTLNVNGGTLNVNTSEVFIGNQADGLGEATLGANGVINAGNYFILGRDGGKGSMEVNGGLLTKSGGGNFIIATSPGAGTISNGTLTQTGGEINVSAGEFFVGNQVGATGTYNISGGVLKVNNYIAVGRFGAAGSVTMSGGTITKTGGGNFIVGIANNDQTASSSLTFSGGLIDVQAGAFWVGEGGNTQVTISDDAELKAPTVQVAVTATNHPAKLSLNGGTVRTGRLFGGAGNATVEFNGTLIQGTSNQAEFLANIDTAEILSGGAIIDTNTFNLGSPAQVISGSGNLTKQGAGTLSLLGASTYSGTTTVSGGKLIVGTDSLAEGAVTVAADAGFGVTATTVDGAYTTSALTLAANTSLDFNLGENLSEYVAPLVVTGALTSNGAANTVTINFDAANLYVASFPLIQYGSIAGSGGFPSFKLGNLPVGVTATLVNNTTTKTIELNITRYSVPEWSGSESSVWDINTTFNWTDSEGSPSTFINNDPAVFSDLASGTTDVTLAVTAQPSTFIFDNTTKNYTLSGAGKVTGSTSIIKRGSGTAVVSTTNDFTGNVRVEGGTLGAGVLTNGGQNSSIGKSSSAAESVTLAGGILSYTGEAATSTDRNFTITGNSSGIGVAQANSNLTLTGTLFPSPTSTDFIKSGAGTLNYIKEGTSTLVTNGAVRVTGGTLVLDGRNLTTPQVVTQSGGYHVGAQADSGGNLTMFSSTLNMNTWFAIGRGTGTNNSVSTVTLNNSTINVNQFSTGFEAGIANQKSIQNMILNDSKFINVGINNIAENNGATTTITLNGNSEYTSIGGNSPLRVGMGGGDAATAGVGNIIANGTSKIVVGSATDTRYTSIGYTGGGNLTLNDSSSFTSFYHFSVNENSAVPSTVNVNGNASLSVGLTYVGRAAGRVGTLTQTGGTVTTGNENMVIGLAGNGTYAMSGGTASVGGWISVGNEGGSVGALNISGGTFNQTALDRAFVIGDGVTGGTAPRGSMTVSENGSAVGAELRVGWGNNAVGTFTQSAGSTTLSKGIIIGEAATANGTLSVSGGSLTINSASGNNFVVGNNASGKGTVNISGTADVKLLNNASVRIGSGDSDQVNTFNISGGTLGFYADATALGGTGEFLIGTTNSRGRNVANLNGGTLIVPSIGSRAATSELNLNGGTIRATGSSATFISGIQSVYVHGNGFTLDSAGHDVTIVSSLLDPGGTGLITKQGAGTLTLAGQNTNLGSYNITAGNLTLAETGKITLYVAAASNSRIYGSGTATLNGAIDFTVGALSGDQSWNLVQSSATYGAGFSLVGFTESSGVWTKTDANGTWTFTESTGVLQLGAGGTPPTNAYNAWIAGFFPGETNPEIIGMDKDPDGDGVPNALEFALGGSPNDGNNRAKVYTVKADSNGDSQQELILTIAVRSGTPAFTTADSPVSATTDGLTTYTIQGSVDLGGFTSKVTPLATPVVTGDIPANAPSGYEYRSFSLDASNGLPNKGFLRVKVDY